MSKDSEEDKRREKRMKRVKERKEDLDSSHVQFSALSTRGRQKASHKHLYHSQQVNILKHPEQNTHMTTRTESSCQTGSRQEVS